MGIVKPTDRTVDDLVRRIESLKSYREQLTKLQEGRNGDFWKALKSTLQTTVDGNDAKIHESLRMLVTEPMSEFASLCKLEGAKMIAEDVIRQVDKAEDLIYDIGDKIQGLKVQLDEARKTIEELKGEE